LRLLIRALPPLFTHLFGQKNLFCKRDPFSPFAATRADCLGSRPRPVFGLPAETGRVVFLSVKESEASCKQISFVPTQPRRVCPFPPKLAAGRVILTGLFYETATLP